jgi:hypothetical protein
MSLSADEELELLRLLELDQEQERLRFEPADYIREKLGWSPWAGDLGQPGQVEIIAAYRLALLQQHERYDLEHGLITEADLKHYRPGKPIQNFIRVEAGHTVGKTKLSSGLVNHFFDSFEPSIIYTFAPSWEQIHDLLWKEIKADRRGKGLPGRILDLSLVMSDDHFAKGRATNNAGGSGTERAQGQHGKYLMFVLDEAEGIQQFVYDAVDSMASGGIVIVLLLANPRTRSTPFYRLRRDAHAANFRLSCLYHPNVLADREVVPGAVRREYVQKMLDKHCEVVEEHNEDDHTFELPWAPGIIYKPNAEFMFRVLGVPPKNVSDLTLFTLGSYEAAQEREAPDEDPTRARVGVDVARRGLDYGTIYVRYRGRIWRWSRPAQQDTTYYVGKLKELAIWLKEQGVTSLHVRVDAGGGFGGGVIDQLKEFVDWFPDFQAFEVHNNGSPNDAEAYYDLVTEMYADAAETLKGVQLEDPPPELEGDLTERRYEWVNKSGVSVKRLESKELFRKRMKKLGKDRSPDDGDGFVLCAASDRLFTRPVMQSPIIHTVGETSVSLGSMIGLGGMGFGGGGLIR